MFNLVIQTLNELARLEKQVLINCFDQSADINIFADSWDIYLTVTFVPSECNIPHGVLVSVQLNSLGGYEPQIYLEDFNYGQTKLIIIKCDNPSCANLKASSAGRIVMESKTEVTFIPAGSVQISRGKYSNCFNDNDSYVELYHGYIVVLLFPTFRCVNTIATAQGQQLIVNTPFKAKVFITYTDNSTTIHDSLQLTVEQSVFIPENKFTPQSVPVRIKLAQPDISQYFDQKISNGVITKDMKIFQIQLYFLNTNYTVPIVKTTRTYINFYLLAGIQNVYSKLSLMFQANGFILKKELNQNAIAANALLTSLGVDSYQIQYTVVMYDVEKTEELRVRLIAQGLDNNQFNDVARQSNCKLRFPNQGCEELMNKLKQMNLYDTTPYITYLFYKGDQIVTNYSKVFDEFVDSCFSTGLLEYNNYTQDLTIIINQNKASKFCTLKRNDALTVEISLGNNSQQLTSLTIDYVPGVQNYSISGFDLTLHPEIRIQYYRSGEFQDAVSLTDYVIQVNDGLLRQELMILLYVLSVNFGFTFMYVLIVVLAVPACKNRAQRPNRRLKEIKLDEEA
ncbi:Conserved_hypothetical protein [Hexamita inflata]|uniref:Uncharacterized protein n=1 Tax=Hexamita inflata TaxID=28002 RepID=A0ABP1GD79_9EUKA